MEFPSAFITGKFRIEDKIPRQASSDVELTLNAPDIIARMLVQRGVDSVEKVNRYFNPRIGDLHDPFLMKDMDKAIERIRLAQDKKEGVLIFGDYDVDGTTSVALAYSFFKDKFDDFENSLS